jgi:TolB-like protein
MADQQNRLSRFWQELKRRRVIHVITVYASASFAIIEIINNLAGPLNLPTSLSTIVIIVLAAGFPLAIILSWLYDLTSGTFERTKPLDESAEELKPVAVPNAWKIATYASFVVIIGLVVLNITSRGNIIKPGSIQSIVVLPFNNYTGQDNLDWFVSGMHSSLIQDMGLVGGLRIIGETSSNAYKDLNLAVTEIASKLNVEAVVEADVLCLGEDSICFQTRLIKPGKKEEQLWIADYKVARNQILNWYKGVTKQIAKEINIELTPEQERLLSKSIIVDREVYDEYLRGLYYLEDLDIESLKKAMEYLNHAVENDPGWAPLYTGLTMVWASMAQMGFESPEVAGPKIFENLNKALELDPDNTDTRFISGEMAYLAEWDWEKSEKELLKALAINPSNAIARVIYAQLLSSLQRPGEALMQANLAIDLDPKNPLIQLQYAAALLCLGDCQNALIQAEKVTADDPGHYLANNIIEAAAFRCRDYDKVIEADKFIMPARGISFEKVEKIFREQGFIAAYEGILLQSEELAQKNFFLPVEMAFRYMFVNQPNKALEWIEKGFEIHDQSMPYITTKSLSFDPLFSNPRFVEIVKKMNLPIPKSD